MLAILEYKVPVACFALALLGWAVATLIDEANKRNRK
jgi:hypothetical protein